MLELQFPYNFPKFFYINTLHQLNGNESYHIDVISRPMDTPFFIKKLSSTALLNSRKRFGILSLFLTVSLKLLGAAS